MYRIIADWLARKPVTKATYIASFAQLVLTLLTVILVVYNNSWLNTANRQLDASIPPNIEITASNDVFTVSNSGAVDISDVRFYLVVYGIDWTNMRIRNRNIGAGPDLHLPVLKAGHSRKLSPDMSALLQRVKAQTENSTQPPLLTIVSVFRRTVDAKRFLAADTFFSILSPAFVLAPLYQSDTIAWNAAANVGGGEDVIDKLLTEIEHRERLRFRISD